MTGQIVLSYTLFLPLFHKLYPSLALSPCLFLQLGVSSLFRNLDLQLLQPVSLSLMYSSPPMANDSSVSLEPMEISAFRLKLR